MWPWSRYEVMTSSPSLDRKLHADDDRFLADIQMAEAADQPHAVELAGLSSKRRISSIVR